MKWLILIGDANFGMDTIKSINHYGSVASYDVVEIDGRYCVDFGEDHIFYDEDSNISDYEEDLKLVPFTNPKILIMLFTSKECAKKILMQDNFPQDIYIDNDFGIITSIRNFISLGMPLDEDDMRCITWQYKHLEN